MFVLMPMLLYVGTRLCGATWRHSFGVEVQHYVLFTRKISQIYLVAILVVKIKTWSHAAHLD